MAKLGSGSVAAQAVSVAAIPVLTRLYAPEAYGLFGIFLSITLILLPVSALRFNAALMLPQAEKDAAEVLALALLAVVGVAAVAGLAAALVAAGSWAPQSWIETGFVDWVWAVPLALAVQGWLLCANAWAVRRKAFGRGGMARVGEALGDRLSALALGLLAAGNLAGLVLGRVAGPLAALIALGWMLRLPAQLKAVTRRGMAAQLRRYRQFPLVSSWAVLADGASRHSPLLLLPLFFAPETVGFYVLAIQMLSLPNLLLGDALASVYFQRATELRQDLARLGEVTITLFGHLLLFAMPVALFLGLFAGPFFTVAFGEAWAEAGRYAQILAPVFLLGFLHRVLSCLFDVFERQRTRLLFDVGLLAARVGAVLGGIALFETPEAALIGLSLATVAVYGATFGYLFRLAGAGGGRVLRTLLHKLVLLAPLIAGLLAAKVAGNAALPLSLAFAAAGLLLQTWILWRFKPAFTIRSLRAPAQLRKAPLSGLKRPTSA